MKALRIDPYKRVITLETLPSGTRSFRGQFAEPRKIGRLPNGDVLWADTNRIHREGFSLGASSLVVGFGLLVGRKDEAGVPTSPRSDIETIEQLVRFAELPGYEVETTPEELTPAIGRFVDELGSEKPVFVPVDPAPGTRSGRCWENVANVVRKHGGQRVHGWAVWERFSLFLTAEFHAIWRDPDGVLVDVTPKADGEERIMFSIAPQYPDSFNFLDRPSNRRHRLYRVEPDVSDTVEQMGSAQRAYEDRKAAKLGLSIEQHLAAKEPLDELEQAIERLFALCAEIDGLIEVRHEGLTSQQPEQVLRLEAEKARVHDRILELARIKMAGEAHASFRMEA